MPEKHASNIELNQYHLSILYASYRFIIGCCLTVIFLLTFETLNLNYRYPHLYLGILLSFVAISSLQLISLKKIRWRVPLQLSLLFVVDIFALSSLTFAVDGPNLHLSLIFVITIFAASLLLERHKALVITLIAMIMVIYQQFIGSFFSIASLNNLGNSALLAFLFSVVYTIGRVAVRRFQLLETVNFSQYLELNRLQNINRYILEQIETGYLVIDENYQIVLSNPAACHLLGISKVYSHEKYPLSKAQPDLFELIKYNQLENGEKFQFESQLSRYHIQIKVQKLLVPHQTLILLVLQDANKINQQVQQLKLAALGQLSASIAHEIRNPLAAIVQANELLTDSDEHQQKLLSGMIRKQSQRIDRIIQDTLDMVRNKHTYPSAIRLKAFIQQLILEDLSDIRSKIKVYIPQDCSISFDEAQLRQVLINLLRNAIRHNAPDASHIEVKVSQHKQHVYIDVRDFGEGVSIKDQKFLFQPFFSTEITGTGLGLYLSHSFCEANQAQLNYIQEEPGACFRIKCLSTDVN